MRIPRDIPLAVYIKRLIAEDKIEQFYFSEDWKELRLEVLEELHNECQECLKTGTYTEAECVHHVNEVRHKPELALSKYYIDKDGKEQKNLIPLCDACHALEHPEKFGMQNADKFTNIERW